MKHLHDQHYDFIVCGAGTAGCVVAARLADLTSSLAIYSIQELFFRRSFDLAPDLKSW